MAAFETRGRRPSPSTSPDLDRFFNPRAVALVGASEDARKFGGRVLRRMLDFGGKRPIYPVNPRAEHILGMPAFASLSDLPSRPDHVGIAVPAQHVLGILQQCADLGIAFATVHTSGFAEAGTARGQALQAQIADLARRTGLRVMGPNSNGLVSFVHGFALSTTGAIANVQPEPGRIGIVAQSGGLGQVNVMYRALEQGLGISHEVSCGNQADLDALDFVDFMVADPHTDVILMVVESIGDGMKLKAVATRAARAQKPIVIVKLGRSESGREAAASHTGAMTGSDAVHSAAFRQFGLIRVDDCNELNAMAMMLRQRRWPDGRRAAAVAASGGHAVLLADLGGLLGIEWTRYGAGTQERLNTLIPDFGQVTNPTDLTTAATSVSGMFADALDIIAEDEAVDVVIPLFTINKESDIRSGAEFIGSTAKPAVMLWTGRCGDSDDLMPVELVRSGVPVFRDAMACLRAVRTAMDYGAFLERFAAWAESPPRPTGLDRDAAAALLKGRGGKAMNEQDSRRLLECYGFPRLRSEIVTSAEEARTLARRWPGPMVMKIASADITHKSDIGGVRLGVVSEDDAAVVYAELMEAASRHQPNAVIDGVLVQEMAESGVELVLGATNDPTFGPVISVGIGGIHVEILNDVVHRLAPVDADQAMDMLRDLRGFPVLAGARSTGARDIDAVRDLVVRLSWLIHDLAGEITEIDVNPLLVGEPGEGGQVLDALVIPGPGRTAAS